MANRARRIFRSTLRWVLRGVLALVFLVLVVLVLVLYSPGFLHMVIDIGLGFYNDRIPGEIRVGRVEGRLADHLVLGDIYLEDHDGRVLVAARELTLDWHPWDLLSGGITVDRVAVADAQVHLVAGGFGDLAPPGPDRPPRETIVPAMPLHLWVGAVEVDDVDLYRDSGETIVGGARLAGRDFEWSGLVAHLEIDDAAAALPGDIQLEALALTADYAEPHLELTGLVTTDLAIAELVRVDLDAASLVGEVLVAVDGRRGALAERLDGPLADRLRYAPGDPSIHIRAQGEAGDLDVGVHAELPGIGGLELAASGRPFGAPRVHVRGRADVDLGGLIPPPHGAQFGLVRPTFEASVGGPDWSRLTGELRLGCLDCGPASGLDLHALARHDSVLDASSAFVELEGVGVGLQVELHAGPRGLEAGRWDLRVPQIAEPLGIARLFTDLPPISGSLTTRGSCTGSPLRCEGEAEVGEFIGYDARVARLTARLHGEPLASIPVAHARVSARGLQVPNYRFAGAEITADVGPSDTRPPDTANPPGVLEAAIAAEVWVRERHAGDRGEIAARVRPGPPLVILLDALDLRMRGLRAQLPRSARIEIAGRRFDVEDLGLLVASGRLGVDGRVDLDGRSDIEARIEGVRLAPLAALVPGLRGKLGGAVSARASLQGDARSPEVSLELGVKTLRFGRGTLGDLDVSASARDGRARAALGLATTMAGRVAVAAEVPLELDLSRGEFGIRDDSVHVAVAIEDLRLASLRPWIGDRPRRGLVSVQATIDGSAARPDVALTAQGRGIVLGSKDLPGSFDLRVAQRSGEDAVAHLEAERLGGRLHVDISRLPARVNLVDGGVQWRPGDHHAATIVAHDIDLRRQLDAVMPGHDLAGRVTVDGSISGPMTAPVLVLAVAGDDLRLRKAQIGDLRLGLGFVGQRASVDLTVRGEVAREVSLHAEAPLEVALHRGEIAWLRDDPHVLDARIREFDLASLAQFGILAGLTGTVDVDARVRGSASAPEFDVRTDLEALAWKSSRIGTLRGEVDYRDRRIQVGLRSEPGSRNNAMARRIAVAAVVPLDLDLSRGKFKIHDGDTHVAVAVEDLRLAALRPWIGDMPRRGLVTMRATAHGWAARPDVALTARGRGIVLGEAEESPPGSFDLRVAQKSGEDAVARLDVERLGGRLRVDVTRLPARVDLVDGGVRWRAEAHHAVTIVAHEIDLGRQLGPLMPDHDLAGRIALDGSISGPLTAPVLALEVDGDDLRMQHAQIGELRLAVGFADQRATVDLSVRGQVAREFSLHAEAPLAVALHRGEVAWLRDDPHVLDAKVRDFDLAGLERLGVFAGLTGTVDVDARLSGSASRPQFQVDADLQEIAWKARRIGTMHGDVDIDYQGKRVKVGLQGQLGNGAVNLRAEAPVTVDLGRGGFKWDENGHHDIELRVDGLDQAMLAPLDRVPDDLLLELDLVAHARGNIVDFDAGLEANGQMGDRLRGGAPLRIRAAVDPKRQSLRLGLGPHPWTGQVGVKVDSKADIRALIGGAAKAADISFAASLRAPRLDLRFARPFIPRSLYDLCGVLSAAVEATGTVGAPDVRGEMHLRGGAVTVLQLQQRIQAIELDVTASGRTIVLEKLSASSGPGRLRGIGRLELPRGGGMKLRSEVNLARFPLVRPGLPQMQIDSEVDANMVSTAEATDINLEIARTRVYVTGYTVDPPKKIPTNPNISFVGDTKLVGVAEVEDDVVSAENEARRIREAAQAASRRFAVRIKLVDPVDIHGPSTAMRWQGSIAAIREGAEREVTGRLTAKGGRLDLLGNRFKLQSGSVTLPEHEDTVDPFIDVVATTSTPVAEVKATFRGRLTRPELVFSSEPSMSQSQILTLLLTGSPDATDADEERVLAQAAALLATFQNPQLSAFLSARLGIDHVGLSFGDDINQPILSVGKRVTKNIYVETAYKHNAPRQKNKVEVRVEYQFAPRWTVETYFGDAAVGGVDLFWRKVFGRPRPQDESRPVPNATEKGEAPGGGHSDAPGGGGTGSGGGGGTR